ncbi:hypothetical protein P22_1531 [Propionispora sp. 2/2-37]|uniref:SPOCS domain-containing protein n=1 Tax=Propionispora sp. 2/2-37 TaxID=1677858 RepID=UPI0006BB8C16|nr:SPOCS domain-containing protein [Propionispora sp. 2/2-37]CUH95460.1 hypothetical protein P22_1531 [Propionispora sp. 2/2-37]
MADDLRQSSGSTGSTSTTAVSVSGTGTSDNAQVICGCPEPGLETIEVEQVLGAEMEQRVVELDMFVPSQKPDIEQVIDVYVKDLEINTVDIIPDKVIVRGDLEVKVMYVADLPDQPVHAFERSHVRFTRDVQIPGALPEMTAKADVQVEYIDYDFCCHEPRKVHITIVLKFWVRVVDTTQMDVYALTPIDQVGQSEAVSATTASSDSTSASSVTATSGSAATASSGETTLASGAASAFTSEMATASQFEGYGEENVYVSGVTPTVGTQPTVSGTATVTGSVVNVRSGPGTNFPIVTKVRQGDVVTIREQAFGWYRVVLSDNATIGWIASWLLG